jgi:hypothetical protein
MNITQQELHDLLVNNECVVTFTKVNGEKIEMPCTLKSDIVPPAPPPKVIAEGEIAKVKKSNPDVVNVWCLDKKEWRSFRFVNLIDVKVKNDNPAVQST